jgi:type II secretory pathway pseudopilin PulG
MVAISLAALAGSTLLLQMNSSTQTIQRALKETIAMGMAQQLMDEVLGVRYSPYSATGADTAHASVLGPSGAASGSRQTYATSGDFHGYRQQPPVDPYGVALGTDTGTSSQQRPGAFRAATNRFANWRQEIDVYYVSESNWSVPASGTTDYRAVEVRITEIDPQRGTQTLAKLRRVIAYVPPLP